MRVPPELAGLFRRKVRDQPEYRRAKLRAKRRSKGQCPLLMLVLAPRLGRQSPKGEDRQSPAQPQTFRLGQLYSLIVLSHSKPADQALLQSEIETSRQSSDLRRRRALRCGG